MKVTDFIFQNSLIAFQILVLLIGLAVGKPIEDKHVKSKNRDTDPMSK